MILCDVTVRWIPRSIWWRFFAEITPRRGSFEDGNGYSYAGLIYRRARRIGPFNLAALRLR